MQNIFLMKHFTQCTFVFTTCVNNLYIFSNKRLHAETLKMGCGVMTRNKKNSLCGILSVKTNEPHGEIKLCAVWKFFTHEFPSVRHRRQ